MAGFNSAPQPTDPTDSQVSSLDIHEFNEVFLRTEAALAGLQDDPRAKESNALSQTTEAMGYVRRLLPTEDTPQDILRAVSVDVIEQTRIVMEGLARDGIDPSTVDLSHVTSTSDLYGLGIGLKALSLIESLVEDPSATRKLDAWNKAGVQDLMADVTFRPNTIPDEPRIEALSLNTL